MDEVLAGNQELQRQLDPFFELALSRYPNASLDAALESLADDLIEVRNGTVTRKVGTLLKINTLQTDQSAK